MNCPGCRLPLIPFSVQVNGVGLGGRCCGRCRGLLFLPEALDAARTAVPIESVLVVTLGVAEPPRDCPLCVTARPMVRHEETAPFSFAADVCDACRCLWLDGGALERLGDASAPHAIISLWRAVERN